jgi:hypothetical protein
VSPLAAAASEAEAGAEYERQRAVRIRENMERMQKLGILDLAHNLSQSAASGRGAGSGRRRRKPVEPGSVEAARVKTAPPAPSRRSLRYGPNRLLWGWWMRVLMITFLWCLRVLASQTLGLREAVECAKICSFFVQHVI